MPNIYPDKIWKPEDVKHIYAEHNKCLQCYCTGCRLYRFETKEQAEKK